MRQEIRDIVFSYWSPSKEIDEWMYDIASDLFHGNTIRNVKRLNKFLYIEEMKRHIDNQEYGPYGLYIGFKQLPVPFLSLDAKYYDLIESDIDF